MNYRALLLLGALWLGLGIALLAWAVSRADAVEITWETATEFGTAGFNVYRSDVPDGEYDRINETLIPAAADATSGATYRYIDEDVQRGRTYYYRLEDVALDSTAVLHDPLTGRADATAPANYALAAISFFAAFVLIGLGLRARASVRVNP